MGERKGWLRDAGPFGDAHELASHFPGRAFENYFRSLSDPISEDALDGGEPAVPTGLLSADESQRMVPGGGSRISRDELGLRLAEVYSLRGTCLRAQVGCVITHDGRPVAGGYAGAPAGLPHCLDVGCDIGNHKGCTRTVHAEANAISFAAKVGQATGGATLYTTLSPCYDCAKLIVNSGIVRVVYRNEYRDTRGLELLAASGVELYAIEP